MNSDLFTKLAFEKVIDDSIKEMLIDLTQTYGSQCNFTFDELYELFKIEEVKKRKDSKMTYSK
tara:strand:+ start:469 stop:657 length:189 start_codon:yes stop_codon:yes gene_type:complete